MSNMNKPMQALECTSTPEVDESDPEVIGAELAARRDVLGEMTQVSTGVFNTPGHGGEKRCGHCRELNENGDLHAPIVDVLSTRPRCAITKAPAPAPRAPRPVPPTRAEATAGVEKCTAAVEVAKATHETMQGRLDAAQAHAMTCDVAVEKAKASFVHDPKQAPAWRKAEDSLRDADEVVAVLATAAAHTAKALADAESALVTARAALAPHVREDAIASAVAVQRRRLGLKRDLDELSHQAIAILSEVATNRSDLHELDQEVGRRASLIAEAAE